MAPKVMKPDEEPGEILNEEELVNVRDLLALLRRKDALDRGDKPLAKLEALLDDQRDIHEIVDGKKASVWVWQQIGAIAKWVGGVIGVIVAYKTFMSGGKAP